MILNQYFADLHVHIGRSNNGQPIKVTGAKDLTFANIAKECVTRKGIEIVGIVDCASPWVIEDIKNSLETQEMVPLPGGGLRYLDAATILLGSELETREQGGGSSHHICFFATLDQLIAFSKELSKHVKNMGLSSQCCKMPAEDLAKICFEIGGIFIPAHAFTPHKSVYGTCTDRLCHIFSDKVLNEMPAIELGLSADTELADRLSELQGMSFLTNSDAHSLPKIAREYNILEMASPNFEEFRKVLWRQEGRRVKANYGLDPKLGKYHRSCCRACGWITQSEPSIQKCERCGSSAIDLGVLDRVTMIQDQSSISPSHRPPYHYQIPLQFIPKVGAVVLNKLLNRFGTEMTVLHKVPFEDLREVVGTDIATRIIHARNGEMHLIAGGGGTYGRVATEKDTGQLRLI